MSERRADVVVIGAGISGLACAHFLAQSGRDVLVLEKSARAGGVIETRRDRGYLYEVGPNSTLDSKPGLGRLVSELGLDDRVRPALEIAKNRFILRDGVLHELPMAPPLMLKSKLFSLRAKLRLAGELFVRRRTSGEDESVADFVRRRFGHEFLNYAIGPFVSGVYAGDPERLSLRSAFPPMHKFETEHGGVIRGAMKTAKERKRRNAALGKTGPSQLITFDDGMAALTDRAAASLGDRLATRVTVTGLEPLAGARWRVRAETPDGPDVIAASAVVMAAPADVASRLVAPLHSESAALLGRIPYAPVVSVFTGFRREQVGHPLDGFGFLVPGVEKRDILGTIFSSSLFAGRAPEGAVALTTFVGGTRRPDLTDLNDGDTVDCVVRELSRIIGVSGAPEFVHISRWTRAIPQYVLGHHRVTDAIDALETEYSRLFFCANYHGGVSVGDCIDYAAGLAARITGARANPDSL